MYPQPRLDLVIFSISLAYYPSNIIFLYVLPRTLWNIPSQAPALAASNVQYSRVLRSQSFQTEYLESLSLSHLRAVQSDKVCWLGRL